MEFNLFIVPITLIVAQLAKPYIPSQHVPLCAVLFGALAGFTYGQYYGLDLFEHTVQGLIYGASASGIYDVAKSTVRNNGA